MSIERNKNLLVIPVNGSPESELKHLLKLPHCLGTCGEGGHDGGRGRRVPHSEKYMGSRSGTLRLQRLIFFILKIFQNWDKEPHLPQSNAKPAARLPGPGPSSLPGQPPPCLGPTRPLAQAPHNLKSRPELIKWDFGTLLLCIPPPSCSRYSWPLRPPRGKLEGRSLPRQSVLLNKRTVLHRGQ